MSATISRVFDECLADQTASTSLTAFRVPTTSASSLSGRGSLALLLWYSELRRGFLVCASPGTVATPAQPGSVKESAWQTCLVASLGSERHMIELVCATCFPLQRRRIKSRPGTAGRKRIVHQEVAKKKHHATGFEGYHGGIFCPPVPRPDDSVKQGLQLLFGASVGGSDSSQAAL